MIRFISSLWSLGSFLPCEYLVATTSLGITFRNVFGKAFGGLTVLVSILKWVDVVVLFFFDDDMIPFEEAVGFVAG
jgi:hypothetical protein